MPRFKTLQTRFTQGEIDPLMIGRVDVDQYYGAAEFLRNVFTLPQGGVRRRPGLEYIDRVLGQITLTAPNAATAPNGGTAANGYDDNSANTVLTTTNISTTNPYVVLRYDMGAAVAIGVVYINDLKLSAAGSSSEFFLQVSNDDATWTTKGAALSITEAGKNFTRRVHGSWRYVRLVRIGSTDLGTRKVELDDMLIFVEAGISNTKLINFEFNVTQTYVFVFSDKNIAVYQNGVYLVDLRVTDYTHARIPFLDWLQNADTLLVYHEDVQTKSIVRGGSNDVWTVSSVSYSNIPTYDFGGGAEAIWSVTRGWPRHAALYQGRIWVDGGKSRPSVVYGSEVNSLFSYDFGTAQDDEAIGPLGFEGFNNIEAIYPGRQLMVFTSGGEYILPQPFGDPITPGNVTVARQSKVGSAQYLRPQETEGGVMYVQRGGKSVQEFIFDDTQNSFANNLLSLISSHLVDDPVDFSLRRATNTEDGAYLLIVLGDGSLTVVNVLRVQGIAAFAKQTTAGSFSNCISDIDDMYFVVEREINGTPVKYFERFNDAHYTDAGTMFTTGLPADTFSAPQLAGEECRVIADSSLMENQTPSGTGSFTIERDAEEFVEIGLNFNTRVKDLPVENPQLGTVLGMPVNVSDITLRLSETAGLKINGKTVSFRGFGPSGGGSPLDEIPPRFTGVKKVMGWRGWTEGGQVDITQEDPLPMTLLALSKRVNV